MSKKIKKGKEEKSSYIKLVRTILKLWSEKLC